MPIRKKNMFLIAAAVVLLCGQNSYAANLRASKIQINNWYANFDGGFAAWPNSHTVLPALERPPWDTAAPANRHLCFDGQRLTYTGENGTTERSDLQDGDVVRGPNCFEISMRMYQYPTNLGSAQWWLIGPEIHGVTLNQAPVQPQVLNSAGVGAQGTGTRNRNSAYATGEPRYFMDANAGRGPHRYWDLGPMVLGEWTYWRFNMNFTNDTSTGFIEVWRGATRVMRVDDATTAEATGGYWKLPNYSNVGLNGTRGYDWAGARIWDGLCNDRSASTSGVKHEATLVVTPDREAPIARTEYFAVNGQRLFLQNGKLVTPAAGVIMVRRIDINGAAYINKQFHPRVVPAGLP